MLLSFAQFEREITGERIRDKVAASKRKGIWMGGAVPLGLVWVRQAAGKRRNGAKPALAWSIPAQRAASGGAASGLSGAPRPSQYRLVTGAVQDSGVIAVA
jgi:DNA invertase Pin-like site-specific DNA recombinase